MCIYFKIEILQKREIKRRGKSWEQYELVYSSYSEGLTAKTYMQNGNPTFLFLIKMRLIKEFKPTTIPGPFESVRPFLSPLLLE